MSQRSALRSPCTIHLEVLGLPQCSPLCTHLQQHVQRQPLLGTGSCKQELPQEELHEHPQLFPCGVGLGRSLETLHNAVTFSFGHRAAGILGELSGDPLKNKRTPVWVAHSASKCFPIYCGGVPG